ncbi:MAG: hypothetical protein ACRYGR_04555 [Janthinobacterium lividum]
MKSIKLKNLYSSICLMGILSASCSMASEQAYEDAELARAIKESLELVPVTEDDYNAVKETMFYLNKSYHNKLNQFDIPLKYENDKKYPTTIRKLENIVKLSDDQINRRYDLDVTLAEKKMFLDQEIEDLHKEFVKLKEYAAIHENFFEPTREEIVDFAVKAYDLNPIIAKNIYDLIENKGINADMFKEDHFKAVSVVAEKPVEEEVDSYNDPTSTIVLTEVGKVMTETKLQDRQKIADLVAAKIYEGNRKISREVALQAYSDMVD